jgi:cell division protein FtsI/penicillin-binding protein 2
VFLSNKRSPDRTSWRNYQKSNRRKRRPVKFLKLIIAVLAVSAVGYGILHGAEALISRIQSSAIMSPGQIINLSSLNLKKNPSFNLDARYFLNLRQPAFTAQLDGAQYRVETSIDPQLQGSLLSEVEKMTAREHYRSRFIGIVVMKPDTGKVLSMVSFDSQDPARNACVNGQFPAASIIKIVTAAAAIDGHGLSAGSPVNFTGRKHTLYRGQLKETVPRYTNTLSLEDSFAQSVNPAFGKIGARLLGKQEIETYAGRFGFNQDIKFDIPVEPSRLAAPDEPYQLAEIASGFNTQTTISPLHGAMIGSAVLNGGQMKAPTIVERITGPSGRAVYERKDTPATRVISEKASRELYQMMMATISSGTARKMFKNANRNAILKELNIGGKTGSINNNPKFDWFVGFAEDPRTRNAIVVSAVVAHEDYIGEKAGQYARIAMESYFSRNSAPAK